MSNKTLLTPIKTLLVVAALVLLPGKAKAETFQIDDVEFFTNQYAFTHAHGVDYCCSDLIREPGSGCISGGNSLIVRSQSQDGLLLNYDVGVVRTSAVLVPQGADLSTSTIAWDFYVRADVIYDIAKFQVMARQGGAEYTLPGVFEPPSHRVCHRWLGSAPLSDFAVARGVGSNGAQLDLRVGADPIAIGWRIFQDANPWQTFFARPKISNAHFTITLTPVGACCAPDGACTVGRAATCDSSGGIYQGDGSACDPNPCPEPPRTGACCVWLPRLGAICFSITEEFCQRFPTGNYLGDGVACRPSNPCRAGLTQASDGPASSPGPCMLADGACAQLLAADCELAGGEFLGGVSICERGSQTPATGTQQVTWGAVKSRYREKPVR
ncbi:MAG: hypothetical protein IT349_09050 [Candidatus Eisenbacteria bacterium]|nr:hypothetical protein [Candidatus Eisenbacteria bacterium]